MMQPPRTLTVDERNYYALNERVYRWFAHVYDAVVLPLRPFRARVVTASGVGPDASLLDVATGTGEQAYAFAQQCRHVVGVDISDGMLDVAARKYGGLPNLSFQHADATDLPFDDASFDAACVSFALHEMPPTIREKTLREMTRVVRRGGRIIVVDYGLPERAWFRPIVFHAVKLYERERYAEFVQSDLRDALGRAGLVEIREDPHFGGAVRLVTARKPAGV